MPDTPRSPTLNPQDPDRLPDSIQDGRERERRFRQESERLQAEQQQQEQRQRDRQARHEAEARQIDEQTRAALLMRVLQAQQAKPQEEPPIPLSTARQDEQLAAEQEAGRRALARYAQRNKPAAAQIDAGEKTTEGLPEFKITQENPNRTPQQQTLFEAEIAAGRNALQNAKPNEVSQNPPTQSTLNPRKIP